MIFDGRTAEMGNLPRMRGEDPNKNPQGYCVDKLPSVLSKMPERNAD